MADIEYPTASMLRSAQLAAATRRYQLEEQSST